MTKTNKELFDYYSKNSHTILRKINVNCHVDTDDEDMANMFYDDVYVLFFYEQGEKSTLYSPGEPEYATIAAIYHPKAEKYFVRKDLHPKVRMWIEDHLVETVMNLNPLYK